MDPVLSELKTIADQQTEINKKLDLVLTKDDLKKRLTEIKQDILSILQEKLDKLEVKLLQIQLHNDELKNNNIKLKQENARLKDEIKGANVTSGIALININNLEQHTRKDSIRLFGVKDEKKDGNVTETINKTVKVLEKIGMTVSSKAISIAHRLGPFNESRCRPIIAKFILRTHKLEALRNRRKLKGTGIGLSEDLTKENYQKLLKIKSHDNVDKRWGDFCKTEIGGADKEDIGHQRLFAA